MEGIRLIGSTERLLLLNLDPYSRSVFLRVHTGAAGDHVLHQLPFSVSPLSVLHYLVLWKTSKKNQSFGFLLSFFLSLKVLREAFIAETSHQGLILQSRVEQAPTGERA